MTTNKLVSRQAGKKAAHARSLVGRIAVILALLLTMVTATAAAASAPAVTGVSPSGGPTKGGQTVLIKGTDFTGTTAVKFGLVDATSFAIVSDTSIVAVVPDAAAAGEQIIFVTNATGTNTDGKAYKYAGPTVTKVSPEWAKPTVATIIAVSGSGFTGALAADVKLNGVAATAIWVVSDKLLIAKTAASGNTAGLGDVVVTRNSVDSETGKSAYLVAAGAPTVSAIDGADTSTKAIGATLTITGTNFLGATQVNFGKSKITGADITIVSATSITVAVPKQSSGIIDVTVTTAAGTSATNLATDFSYLSTTAPTVSSVFPEVFAKAAGGTFLMYGKGFTGIIKTDVILTCEPGTTTPATTSITVISDTAAVVVIPANTGDATGTCDLKVQNGTDSTLNSTLTGAVRYV